MLGPSQHQLVTTSTIQKVAPQHPVTTIKATTSSLSDYDTERGENTATASTLQAIVDMGTKDEEEPMKQQQFIANFSIEAIQEELARIKSHKAQVDLNYRRVMQ